jgi:CxxC motif-containing protein (DUF1111 family)
MGSLPLLLTVAAALIMNAGEDENTDVRRAPDVVDTIDALGTAGAPSRALAGVERERWLAGRATFARERTPRDGLGPAFNATSCAACHRDPAVGGAGGLEFNVVLAADDPEAPASDDAIARYLSGRGGGTLERELKAGRELRPSDLELRLANTLQTPSMLGLGLLERVHEDEILGREDPHDRDGDGVRGFAKRVRVGGAVRVGRFGWRADLPTLNDFTRAACGGELGLTVPAEVGFGRTEDGDLALDPEMTWAELDALVFFCSELAPPARGGRASEPEVARGEALFAQVGCATCHVPTLYGADGAIHPYTDLLLHAVVPDLPPSVDRGGEPSPFRTPPLWGVAHTAPYLHDGRAPTLADAIAAHGGEADAARGRFERLSAAEREAVLAFLADL